MKNVFTPPHPVAAVRSNVATPVAPVSRCNVADSSRPFSEIFTALSPGGTGPQRQGGESIEVDGHLPCNGPPPCLRHRHAASLTVGCEGGTVVLGVAGLPSGCALGEIIAEADLSSGFRIRSRTARRTPESEPVEGRGAPPAPEQLDVELLHTGQVARRGKRGKVVVERAVLRDVLLHRAFAASRIDLQFERPAPDTRRSDRSP